MYHSGLASPSFDSGMTSPAAPEAPLTSNEVKVVTGVLGLARKTIKDVLIPIEEIAMLSYDQVCACVLKNLYGTHITTITPNMTILKSQTIRPCRWTPSRPSTKWATAAFRSAKHTIGDRRYSVRLSCSYHNSCFPLLSSRPSPLPFLIINPRAFVSDSQVFCW
jgi:hypothetical protein